MKRPSNAMLQPKTPAGRPKDTGKRDSIVRAASHLFMNEGYELTSMEAVAKKAGVSKLTIYSHFADKNDLFREVIGQRCQRLATPESYAALEHEPAEKALLQLGTRFTTLVFNADSIRLHRIMQAEAPRHPKVVQIFYEAGPKRVREAFNALLKAWVKQGQLSIPDIPKATEQFFSLLKGEMLMKALLHRTPIPSETEIKKHVRATVSFFLSAYGTKTKH
jgi:TetR/AcrR family transcriptional regulator, mexJK operon transcriptional repressor